MAVRIGDEVRSTVVGLTALITQTLSEIPAEEIGAWVQRILAHKDNKILIVGAGRSGLVGGAFALRLLHLGFQVHVLGDTLVPSVDQGDLVIALSGSGTTRTVTTAVEAAKNVGAEIIAITSYPDSPIGRLADTILSVRGRVIGTEEARRDYFARQILGLHEPLAPLGTLFEDACVVLLDGIVAVLMGEMQVKEEELGKRHANIE